MRYYEMTILALGADGTVLRAFGREWACAQLAKYANLHDRVRLYEDGVCHVNSEAVPVLGEPREDAVLDALPRGSSGLILHNPLGFSQSTAFDNWILDDEL